MRQWSFRITSVRSGVWLCHLCSIRIKGFLFLVIYVRQVALHILQCCRRCRTVRSVHRSHYILRIDSGISLAFTIWSCMVCYITCIIFHWIYFCTIFRSEACWHDRIVRRYLVIYFHSDRTNTVRICFTRYDSGTFTYEFHFVRISYLLCVIFNSSCAVIIRNLVGRYNPAHIT